MTDEDDDEREIRREERAIYWIITAALSPVLVGIALDGRDLDGGGTLSLIFVVLGVIGLLAGLRVFASSSRIPRARVHRRER
jgi:hypothetical protein